MLSFVLTDYYLLYNAHIYINHVSIRQAQFVPYKR